ncbi:MAG: hypothetical protein NWR72_03235 [Bacteroidia bacterium]|nr:hypothetical protein [Bacteroidia bacterium]
MKTFILYSGILLALVSLSACQQVDVQPISPNPSASASSTQNALTPQVLFQYAEYDGAKNELSGFLLDREGVLRTYTLTEIPSEYQYYELRRMPDWVLREVLEASVATSTRVRLEELRRYHQSISRVRNHELRVDRRNPYATRTIAFYAFSIIQADDESNYASSTCGDRKTHETDQDSQDFLFIPLQSEGSVTLKHTASATDEIVAWLASLADENITK